MMPMFNVDSIKSFLNKAFSIRPAYKHVAIATVLLLLVAASAVSKQTIPQSVLESKARELQEGLTALAGPPEDTKLDPKKPLRAQTRFVELAGRRFEIPLMYFDTALAPGEHQDSMLLEVYWPDMKSKYDFKDRAEQKRAKMQEHRVGWILLEPAAGRTSLEHQNRTGEESLTKLEAAGMFDGLYKKLWFRGTKDKPELWAEVYLEKDPSGRIVSFIRCSRGASSRFPRCQHRFVHDDLIYSVSYNEKTFLFSWREQRDRAIEFLRSFEITKPTNQ